MDQVVETIRPAARTVSVMQRDWVYMKLLQRILTLACIGTVLAVMGCSKSALDTATGKGTIKAIHGSPGLGAVNFRIEERLLATINYRENLSGARYDDLSYQFNFDLPSPTDGSSTRIASSTLDVQAGVDYTFVLTGTADNAAVTVWERPEKNWEGNEPDFALSFGHVAEGWGDLDFYFAAPGTAPTAGAQVATLAFGERAAEVELAAGDYVLFITAAGNPNTVYFESGTIAQTGGRNLLIVAFEGAGTVTSQLSVQSLTAGSNAQIADVNSASRLRAVHANIELGNADIYVGQDFDTKFVDNIGFTQFSAYQDFSATALQISVTPFDNVGVISVEQTFSISPNGQFTTFLMGTAAEPLISLFRSNERTLDGIGTLKILQGSENHANLDLYVEAAGTDITEENARLPGVPSRAMSSEIYLSPGSYELTATVRAEKTIVAGPFAFEVVGNSLQEIVIVDTVDPATADFLVITDIAN